MKPWLVVSLCVGLFATDLLAAEPKNLEEEAVLARNAFDKGQFADAVQHYQEIISAGIVNGELYYNAGLSFYRTGDIGHALAAFLAARNLLPRDPDVRANIKASLVEIDDKLDANPNRSVLEAVVFWVPHMTMREMLIMTAATAAVIGGFLWLTLLLPRFYPWRTYTYLSLLVPLLMLGGCYIKRETQKNWGAVTVEESRAFSGPGTANTLVFELSKGAPFVALESVEGWTKVQLSGGKRGWLAETDIKVYPQ
jgi:tetratricopeptide (TPR) repeat protein